MAQVPMAGSCTAGRVALFADTFTNYYEPGIAAAAVELIEAAGFRAVVPPRVCCGRPLISKGFLEEARGQAEAVVQALRPLAREGVPVVFCEPGCYSAVRDDLPKLLRGELQRDAEAVAAACVTFEEWAVAQAFQPAESAGAQAGKPPHVLLHAHCHQRALVGTGPAVRLLSAIPGCRVTDLDSGCCGMAGSFGYEREHYEISRLVGEHRLFPALRAITPATVVVAPGFSCRHQIRHFTGIEAVHPATLICSLLAQASSYND